MDIHQIALSLYTEMVGKQAATGASDESRPDSPRRRRPPENRATARCARRAGCLEWRGCQGLDRKPHAERRAQPEPRTGEDRGEANP